MSESLVLEELFNEAVLEDVVVEVEAPPMEDLVDEEEDMSEEEEEDEPEPQNGCDEEPKPELLDNEEEMTAEEPLSSEFPDGENSSRTSRELKSILALSKEANLDTNLSLKRRKSEKRTSTRMPNITNFPVTAESELENYDVNVEDKKAAKKRKSSFSDEPSESALREEVRRGLQETGEYIMPRKPNKDTFCWRCHHDCVQIACETCPRSYHLKCLKQIVTDMEHWPCPECVAILKAENTQTRTKAMKGISLEHLCNLLKFAVKRMIQCNGSEPFIHSVDEAQFPEYRSYIINPMTLTMLEKNIKENLYGSTQAFEADAKWILHNSIIFNSYFPDQSKLTTAAKTIVKICKQEMAEVENCPSCYLNANTKKHTWFVEVCPKPHLLVWAKLKGFPYWPAKVMSINSSGMVDVRFFGAHDKAWVSVRDCYLYSVKDPNSGKQKRNDIIECVKELELYVDNLKLTYGKVNLASFKTMLDPENQAKQLQLFLPNFKNDEKEVLKKVIDAMESSLMNQVSDDSSFDDSQSSEEEDEDDEDDDMDEEMPLTRLSEVKTNGEKQVMTRVDYRTPSTGPSPQPSEPHNQNDRYSSDDETLAKLSQCDSNQNEAKPTSPTQDTIDKKEESLPTNPELELTPSKLKITDQLIKKLENINEETKIGTEREDDKKSEVLDAKINQESKEVQRKEETAIKENKAEIIREQLQSPRSSILDEEDKSEDMIIEMDAANIRSIIHSSLVEPILETPVETPPPEVPTGKKRKMEEVNEVENEEKKAVDVFPPAKMVKLVPIENILEKKTDAEKKIQKKPEQLIVLKEVRNVKNVKEIRNRSKKPPERKKQELIEPVKIKSEAESDEDSDILYMEAKRKYLSALNISEKQKVPIKPKINEIRTRSKTEEKKSRCTDNLSKTIEEVATNHSQETTKSERPKEIYIKSLSKLQTPKHKARKSFPTPNYGKKAIITRKIISKGATTDDDITILNTSTLQPANNVMILPKLHYNKNAVNVSAANHIALLPAVEITVSPATGKKGPEGSQNYIPQNEDEGNERRTGNSTILLNNILNTSTITAQPVIDVETPSIVETELGALNEILPEAVSKGMNEILFQPPPKLKPKPVGLLNSIIEGGGVPSSAGPVASRINSIAQKLGDYFRNLVVETINDLGKSNNTDATISSLKYEIEELNHRHSTELAEIRRNVSIVLKDIQKSVVEEKERIINETKANCEMEMNKRVEEAKSKQWCANCSKEAQFYCCWNTSYCDYPCQQKHWLKHMSKCTQTTNQPAQPATSTPLRTPTTQQLVLTPTSAPKFGAFIAKPQKVYLKRGTPAFKQSSNSHITLVESTPGNFELLGGGPLTVNGKILTSTSVIEKIKSANIVSVTAPSATTSTQIISVSQKVKTSTKSTPSPASER